MKRMTKTYRLPPAFWYDHHVNRECSRSAVVERETKSYVIVTLDEEAFKDLRSDADYYVETAAAGAFDAGVGGLVASARATLKRLDADPLGDERARDWTFASPASRPGFPPFRITVRATNERDARNKAECKTYGAGSWALEPKGD